jgi:hypothetical protein
VGTGVARIPASALLRIDIERNRTYACWEARNPSRAASARGLSTRSVLREAVVKTVNGSRQLLTRPCSHGGHC